MRLKTDTKPFISISRFFFILFDKQGTGGPFNRYFPASPNNGFTKFILKCLGVSNAFHNVSPSSQHASNRIFNNSWVVRHIMPVRLPPQQVEDRVAICRSSIPRDMKIVTL